MNEYKILVVAQTQEKFLEALKEIVKEMEEGRVVVNPDFPGWACDGFSTGKDFLFTVDCSEEEPLTPEQEKELVQKMIAMGFKADEQGNVLMPAIKPPKPTERGYKVEL